MKAKKLALIFVLFVLCLSAVFGGDTYNIVVNSADDMKVADKIVTLTGNVSLSLKTTSDDKNKGNKDRKLTAQKVVFNLDEKLLQASGLVHLTEGSDTAFDGDVISLNWENLDVVVFSGGSSSSKKNTQGSNVTLFTMGDRVSYEGETQSVFFEKGMVGTRAKDPYWSISAKQIGMANSDLFFTNAVFKIGRVPFFWLPVFFYPGSRLSINPAIGISSDKGMFLNTTFELYGVYPGINSSSGSSSSSSSESDANDESKKAALAIFSMLASGEQGETIRDGFAYRKVKKDEELSKVESWARKTNSYFALFADAFENNGISLGFDTKNRNSDSSLTLNGRGLIAYRFKPLLSYYKKTRYFLDVNFKMKVDKTNLAVFVPVYSDPNVEVDFMNRNTVFGLDAALGVKQTLPSLYSSSKDSYDVKIESSFSGSKNGYSFNVSKLNALINYKWQYDKHKYEVYEAKLPEFVVSSGGTFFNLKQKQKEKKFRYDTALAQEFADEYESLGNNNAGIPNYSTVGMAQAFIAPTINKTVSNTEQGYLKLAYSYNQTFNNIYKKEFKHSSFSTAINPSVTLSGSAGGNWFTFTETLKPHFEGTYNEGSFSFSKFTLSSEFTATSPNLGLAYHLNTTNYTSENRNGERSSRFGNWDNKDVSSHNLSFSKTIKDFSFSITQTFKPLTENIVPSLSYSHKGFSASANTTLGFDGPDWIQASTSNGRIGYSNKYVTFNFSNSLNHKADGFDGYTGSQNFSLYLLKNRKLVLTESLELEKEFKAKSFNIGANYNGNSVNLSYKGENFDADALSIYLHYNILPIYKWKNRIGFESSMQTGFNYNFKNKFAAQFYVKFNLDFQINKFLGVTFAIDSVNNGFYMYYEGDSFKFKKMWEDLKRSFDFFGSGRTQTQFNLNSMSVAFTHYMEDWNLKMEARSSIKTDEKGRRKFSPEITVAVKWNAIPELKVETKYNEKTKEWEKN